MEDTDTMDAMPTLRRQMKAVLIFLLLCGFTHGLHSQARNQAAGKGRELVFVRCTVTDPLNRYLTGLESNSFRVYEKSLEKPIAYFSKETVPISLAVVADLRQESEARAKQLSDFFQQLLDSSRPEDEFFLITYNPKTMSVETIRRQGSLTERLASIPYISGLRPLEQTVMAGCSRVRKRAGKSALALITAGTEAEIARAYDVTYKTGDISDLAPMQFFTIKRSGLAKSSMELSEKSYVIESLNDVGYYLGLVYSELRSQYLLAYTPSIGRPTGNNLKVRITVESPKGLPKLVAKPGKPWYSQLP